MIGECKEMQRVKEVCVIPRQFTAHLLQDQPQDHAATRANCCNRSTRVIVALVILHHLTSVYLFTSLSLSLTSLQ